MKISGIKNPSVKPAVEVGDRLLYVGYTKTLQAIVVETGDSNSCQIRWYKRHLPIEGPNLQEDFLEPGKQEVFFDEFTDDIRQFGFFNLSRGEMENVHHDPE